METILTDIKLCEEKECVPVEEDVQGQTAHSGQAKEVEKIPFCFALLRELCSFIEEVFRGLLCGIIGTITIVYGIYYLFITCLHTNSVSHVEPLHNDLKSI